MAYPDEQENRLRLLALPSAAHFAHLSGTATSTLPGVSGLYCVAKTRKVTKRAGVWGCGGGRAGDGRGRRRGRGGGGGGGWGWRVGPPGPRLSARARSRSRGR